MLRQKEVVINEVAYKLQAIPFKSYMTVMDKHTNKHGVLMKTPYISEMLEHCVIEPKITLADFDEDFQSGMELVAEIESFLQSKADTSPSKKEGKK